MIAVSRVPIFHAFRATLGLQDLAGLTLPATEPATPDPAAPPPAEPAAGDPKVAAHDRPGMAMYDLAMQLNLMPTGEERGAMVVEVELSGESSTRSLRSKEELRPVYAELIARLNSDLSKEYVVHEGRLATGKR